MPSEYYATTLEHILLYLNGKIVLGTMKPFHSQHPPPPRAQSTACIQNRCLIIHTYITRGMYTIISNHCMYFLD